MTPAGGLRLGVALGVEPPEELVDLCRELARRTVVGDAGDGRAQAMLRRAGDPALRTSVPTVLWVDAGVGLEQRGPAPALVLTPDAAVAAAAGSAGLPVRRTGAPLVGSTAVPVAPFVRARIRQARGLPECALAVQGPDGWHWEPAGLPLAAALVPTALAAAAACTVSDRDGLLAALSWGCPTVAPAALAEPHGLEDGRTAVLLAPGQDPAEAARALAHDRRLGARTSWAGRRLFEDRYSVRHAADAVLAAVGAPGRWSPSSLTRRLEELDSAQAGGPWRRAEALLADVVALPSAEDRPTAEDRP